MMLYPAMNKLTGYIPNRYMLVAKRFYKCTPREYRKKEND